MTDAVERARAFLESLGLDASADPELARTPERVAELLESLFASAGTPAPSMSVFSLERDATDPVIVCALPFQSMCVHHLMPFFGTVDIAYVPGRHMAGFGSFGRVVDWAANRPQVQERLVELIADTVQDQLRPEGLLVRCRARQMCVEMRGARKRAEYVSIASRGDLERGDERALVLQQFLRSEEPI